MNFVARRAKAGRKPLAEALFETDGFTPGARATAVRSWCRSAARRSRFARQCRFARWLRLGRRSVAVELIDQLAAAAQYRLLIDRSLVGDLARVERRWLGQHQDTRDALGAAASAEAGQALVERVGREAGGGEHEDGDLAAPLAGADDVVQHRRAVRSEEHTSELQS